MANHGHYTHDCFYYCFSVPDLFYSLRKTITNSTELNMKTSMAHSRDMVISVIKEHEDVIEYAATGIMYLSRVGKLANCLDLY
jgi:hypothetical protein